MKTTILGTGIVARTIAIRLAEIGHAVTLATRDKNQTLSRNITANSNQTFESWLEEQNNIQLTNFSDLAADTDIVFNATNGGGALEALNMVGKERLIGKILIDISNPLDFSNGMPPTLFVCNDDSLGEQIQSAFPETKVIKSLNTMNTNLMLNPSILGGDHCVFMSGNDTNAKAQFGEILAQAGWKENCIIDLGDITTARGTEQLLPLWIRLWGSLGTSEFNFNIVKNN